MTEQQPSDGMPELSFMDPTAMRPGDEVMGALVVRVPRHPRTLDQFLATQLLDAEFISDPYRGIRSIIALIADLYHAAPEFMAAIREARLTEAREKLGDARIEAGLENVRMMAADLMKMFPQAGVVDRKETADGERTNEWSDHTR